VAQTSNAAPPWGEHGGAHGVLDGEAGDDDMEELIGKGADAALPVALTAGNGGEGAIRSDSNGEGRTRGACLN
jgi:hypothetical protein